MGWLSKAWKGLRKLSNFLGLGIPNLIEKTLKKWLTPKVPDKEALKVPRQGSDQFIPVVYGTREVGAIVVDRNVTDQSGGAANEFLHVMCVFCYGEIDGFEEFYFGDVSWNDKRWLKDKNNPNGAKWFTYELRTGTVGQSAVNAIGKLNSFSSENSKYEGLAVAFFTFQQDKDQSIWQGEPQIKARVRGKKCLDPRTGVTAYTENPAIHLVDYLSNNIYSLGLTSEDYDIQSFIDVANISDIEHTATIDTRTCKTEEGVYSCTGTPAEVVTFKRYSHNNIIDTQQSIFDNIQEIANCFRGYFPNSDGRLSVASEMESGSVFSFNEDNMVSSITSEVPDRNSRFNRVIVRFPNKANNYEKDECAFPDADSQTEIDWLAEDNGTTQEKVISVEYTVYKAEALQLARIAAYVSRYADTITFSATPEANILDVGDVFDVTDSTRGWDARLFRVSDIQYRDDGLVNITGVQHENAVYPWLGMSYTDIIGGSNLGDPSNIAAPFGLTITPDETFATAGLLSWESVNDAFIRRFTVTVLSGEDVIYRTESLANNWPIPLLDAGDYSIQVRAVSTIGSLSPEAVIALTLTAPVAPTDIIFNASNFEIEARPVLLGQGLGTTFEFAIDSESPIRGKGQTIVFTGLNFGTEYTVFARTVNALGISAWFSKTVSTTADSGQIIDLVGNDMYVSIFEPTVEDLQGQITVALELAKGVDLELDTTNQNLNILQQEVDTLGGASVRDSLLSISRLQQSGKETDKLQFFAEATILAQKNNLLEVGGSVALADRKLQAVATDLQAVSQEVLNLESSFGSQIGQLNADVDQAFVAITNSEQATASAITSLNTNLSGQLNAQSDLIQRVSSKADGTASSLASLGTKVTGIDGELSSAQLTLNSTVDELGVVSSRAFLGTTSVAGGKAVINGIVVDGATNALEFRANTLRLADTAGNLKLYWDSTNNAYVFNGRLVIGGYEINSVDDIRAQDGDTGAGFYGSTYAAISWTTSTANSRFLALVGRNPVNLDIFTQTRQDGTDSQARQYNGTSWVAVALQVNGSIIASGTIAGDRLVANASISAPKIKGGSFELIGSTYFKYFSGTPFGPHSLIEWYGPKVNGLTWNATTLEPILAGMSKSNATSYTDAIGKAYFGGGIVAGDFRNAITTTQNSAIATSPSLVFGSNGGLIDIVLTGNNSGFFFNTNGAHSAGRGTTSFTILLEKKIGTNWAIVATLNGTGTWSIRAENSDRLGDCYCAGSLTYTDTDQNTNQREYRARMTTRDSGNVPVTNQEISIVTSEVN